MQERCPTAYFSENISRATLNYPTYDREMYALIWVLETGSTIFGQRSL